MGPQNQVGMHETTNLFIQRETFIRTTDLDTGLKDVAAVNANIRVKKNSAELSSIVIILLVVSPQIQFFMDSACTC